MSYNSIHSFPQRYYNSIPLPSISTTMIILSFFANFGTSMSRNIMFTLITSMTDVTKTQTFTKDNSTYKSEMIHNESFSIENRNMNEKSEIVYEFSWSEMEQNWVLNAYFAGLLLMTIPSGYMAFRHGPKCVAAWGGVATIVVNILSPFSARFQLNFFIFMRFLLGVSVSTVMPSILQIVSNWIPEHRRGVALAAISSGSMVGNILLNIVSSYMIQEYGWASVFYLVTLFNSFWVVIWIFFVSDKPDEHRWIFDDEIEYISNLLPIKRSSKKILESKPPPYHKMLKNRSVWVTILVKMAQNFYYYITIIKLQYYQTSYLKTTFEENCMLVAMFHIAILTSTNIGGYIADVLLKQDYEVAFVRKLSEMTSGFLTLYFFLMVPFCETKTSFGIVTFLSAFGNGLNVGGSGAALLDLTTEYVANLTSLINFITLFVGWSTPLIVTGLLKISNGDWTVIFGTASAALFLSSIAFGLFVQPENQHWEFTTLLSTTLGPTKRKSHYRNKHKKNFDNDEALL